MGGADDRRDHGDLAATVRVPAFLRMTGSHRRIWNTRTNALTNSLGLRF